MGSPMVFHTAPPQPASKARMICSPQLVGGAEASQKGLGQRMPAKLVVRSANRDLLLSLLRDVCGDAVGGALAVSDGVDYLAAAVDAVSAGEVPGIRGQAAGAVDDDT